MFSKSVIALAVLYAGITSALPSNMSLRRTLGKRCGNTQANFYSDPNCNNFIGSVTFSDQNVNEICNAIPGTGGGAGALGFEWAEAGCAIVLDLWQDVCGDTGREPTVVFRSGLDSIRTCAAVDQATHYVAGQSP
ncbi:hypothetical protein F5884DRAFT_752018 [Xylogone sp. PMI_703]|nr:hypothetical protein F5884DRAFT_752018 [Xylogone sp. PMI_703]